MMKLLLLFLLVVFALAFSVLIAYSAILFHKQAESGWVWLKPFVKDIAELVMLYFLVLAGYLLVGRFL